MIKISDKEFSIIPSILQNAGMDARNNLQSRYDTGERQFVSDDFDSGIYGHPEVKTLLKSLQHDKCCFCESKVSHISYGDVEHFRPKAGWVQDDEKINKPGYYWLAYNWDNLLLSCQLCNQRYKKNYFPLLDVDCRVNSHHSSIDDESPVFINPAKEDAEQLITFVEEIAVAVGNNVRGNYTIEALGIDRDLLNERRLEKLAPIRHLYNLAKDCPHTEPVIREKAKAIVIGYYNESALDTTQYASMLRSFFKANPIDF